MAICNIAGRIDSPRFLLLFDFSSHSVEVSLKASVGDKFRENVLVKNGHRARKAAELALVFGQKRMGKYHISHSHRGRQAL